jgi:hypothetical protein
LLRRKVFSKDKVPKIVHDKEIELDIPHDLDEAATMSNGSKSTRASVVETGNAFRETSGAGMRNFTAVNFI